MNEEYLMVGSFGLDVDAWQGGFYDDQLPADWRVASYSTLLRSVLLPQAEWQKAVKEDWINEVDEEFRFVLYAESSANEKVLSSLVKEFSMLPVDFSAQVAGIVLQLQPELVSSVSEAHIKEIQSLFPLCLDAGKVDISKSGMDVFCDSLGLCSVWYPAVQTKPLPSGDFLVTLINRETLPEQREIVTQIDHWMSGQRRAGLFNTNKEDAPQRAQETRILVELMGV
jgi:hypothetical protein